MASSSGAHDRDQPETYNGRWQDTVDLLRLMQSDYEGARAQLDRVSQSLADRENLLNERLQYALLQSSGCRTLCLAPSQLGAAVSLLGGVVLGEIATPPAVPRTARLEVRCLGAFEVACRGNTITRWQSSKSRTVLQYLLVRPGEPVPREVLMEALWPECDPQAAGNNLKAAVHGLRQTLAAILDDGDVQAGILFTQGRYQLSRSVELWLDVDEFEQRWATGRRLEKEGRNVEAIREFELAAALYQGDYLQDEPYEEWTLLRREKLRDIFFTIAGRLADHAMTTGDYEAAIAHCQQVIDRDPCREDVYRRLMRCYSRFGQRHRALRWYEICRRTVRAELDAEPDPETQTLYRRLMNNETL